MNTKLLEWKEGLSRINCNGVGDFEYDVYQNVGGFWSSYRTVKDSFWVQLDSFKATQKEAVDVCQSHHEAILAAVEENVKIMFDEGFEQGKEFGFKCGVEESKPKWIEGYPSKPWADEWFQAITEWGDRVVLIALPEEYSYDFKTADHTYIKKEKIKRWMQFPDSDYVPPAPMESEAGK